MTRHPTLTSLLRGLYRDQLAFEPGNAYLQTHAKDRVVESQVRTFEWYAPYLPPGGTILDWGCNHMPDSCLIRESFGERFDLHACDFPEPGRFRAFADFCRADYRRIVGPVALPYDDGAFDAVIASGVLELTAQDYESLRELYRVLKPGGIVAVSYLPNRFSVGEWRLRRTRKPGFHVRRYGFGEATTLLLRAGLVPLDSGYQFRGWERLLGHLGLGRWDAGFARVCRALVPVHHLASTLRFVARKVVSM